MSLPEPLQNFWNDQTAIISALYDRGEISLAQSAQNIFAKSLILTSASYFENELKELVSKSIAIRSKNDVCIMSFCQRKAIDRQFHTWFDWDRSNANVFFSMFGDETKLTSNEIVKAEVKFENAIRDYLFIGRKRNEIVHKNFLTYFFDETANQVRTRIESAVVFMELADRVLTPMVDQ